MSRSPSPLDRPSSPAAARGRNPPSNLPQNVLLQARNNPDSPHNDLINRPRPVLPMAFWATPRNSPVEYHGYGEGGASADHPPAQVSPGLDSHPLDPDSRPLDAESHTLDHAMSRDPSPVSRGPVQVEESKTPTHNWQASKSTIGQRLAFIYNNEALSDVRFLVGKGSDAQRIPGHKFVLSIGSAVFDAMFNGGMAMEADQIEIPDVEPPAFLALLKFLYTDEVAIGPGTVMATLYVAKKYAVPALETACVDLLKAHLSPDNAFLLLSQARLFDEPQLAVMCLQTIDKNATEAFAADGFVDIDHQTMCAVLERDTVGIRECKLFTALWRWAEAECRRQELEADPANIRLVIGSALDLIRFPLMSVEEFAVGPAQSGILLDREVVNLFLYFTVNPKPTITFSDVSRCCLTGKEQTVNRFMQIESRWGYSGTSDRIRFMVSQRIYVVGFGLYGSIHGSSEYIVNIQIIHHDTGRVCGQNSTSFQSDGTHSTFRVLFREPVEVLPHTSYLACATLNGPDSYYGTRGARKVNHESVACGKITFHFTYAAGNNNGTSVEDGQIPELIFYC